MADMTRRNFLKGTGAAAATATSLSGCLDQNSGNKEENYEDNNTDRDTGPSYELKLSVNGEVDLSELPTSELGSLDEIRSEDYVELEYRLLEENENGREKVDPDHIKLMLEGENGEENNIELGPEVDNAYQIACYDLLEGENDVTLEAEIDGETVEASDTTEKKTPETYRAEVQIDGENLDSYTTPYQFDTINVDTEEYQRLRQETINQDAWNGRVVEPTLENERHNFNPGLDVSFLQYTHGENEWITENFQNHEDLRKIIQDAGTAWMKKYDKEIGGPPSGDMINNAATTIQLVDRHHNQIPEGENRYEHEREIDLEGGHFSTVGHGQALFYERNTQQWLNFDPQGAVVTKPAEAPDIDDEDRFYAPIEYMIGKPENHNGVRGYDRKKEEGLRSIAVTTQLGLISSDDFDADDHWIKQNTNKIGRDEPLGQETENILRAATITAYKTENQIPIIYGGDQNENRLLITENEQHWEKFRSHDNPEPVTTEEVQTEMLT